MKLELPYQKGLNDESGKDYRYYGKDAEEFLKSMNWEDDIKYLGKECKDGIIIGIEDSNSYNDYYFIVYDPRINEIKYKLANGIDFIDTIIL